MSRNIPNFLHEYQDIYSGFLDRARSLIVDGYWHLKGNRVKFKLKAEDFGHIQNATEGVLEALEILIDTAEGERSKPGVQPMINEVLSTINVHLERISKYYPKNDPKGFKTKDDQREEGKFQQLIFKGEQKIKAKIKTLNIDNNMDSFEIKFFDKRIATLPMKQVLCDLIPEVAAKVESLDIDWDLIMDNGLLINIPKRDIPDYNERKHFWDQDPESLQFWVSEWNKINKGITIDGYEMSHWMYFHLNYFKTPIKNQGNKIMHPPLRDNEWYVDEIKKYAKRKAEELLPAGILIYGTRRFAKSTVEASHCHHGLLIFPTETGTITASNTEDLSSITDKMTKSMDYIHPAFAVNVLSGKGWDKEVDIGLKSGSGAKTYLLFKFFIINTDSGSKSGSQKTAGGNPIVFVADEIGKEQFLKSYRAAIPSFESDNGWVCHPLYVGCLTKGNKVFTKEGNLVNIEVLKKEDGIMGFNKESQETSFESINHINPPQNKDCYLVETNKGTKVECSYDHPFLVKNRNKTQRYTDSFGNRKDRRKLDFVEAKNLEKGDLLSLPDTIPLKGSKVMENPYFIGAIIGDGNYSGDRGIRFYNEDKELWDYMDSIKKDYTVFKNYTTKKGREYKEARFRGGMSQLKQIGIYGQSGEKKDLPEDIHLYTENCIVELIAGLFDTDGTVYATEKSSNKISISSASEKMIDSLKLLLIRLGIHSNKFFRKPDKRGRKIRSKKGHYDLSIQDRKSMLVFADKIPLKIERKKEAVKKLKSIILKRTSRIDSGYEGLRFERIVKVEYVGIKPVYNLTTSDTNTYLANGVVTHNTGGDEDLSADAEKALADPAGNDFIEMDWDILEHGIPKHLITWTRRKFGWFIPAQMSTKTGFRKIKTNFADFLGIKSEQLSKIPIDITDWEHNNKIVKERRAALSGAALQQEIVFRPIDPEECFMSAKKNPFPATGIKRHRTKLQSEGDKVYGLARKITLHRNSNDPSKIEMELNTDKEVNEYPHNGSFTDCPFLLYDSFPEVRPSDPYRFVAGCLTPGEQVITDKGLMNVEAISFEEKLINKEGKLVDILALQVHEKVDEDIYTIKVGNSYRGTTFTKEHPIFVSRPKFYEAGKSKGRIKQFNFGKEEFLKASKIRKGDWIKYPNIYRQTSPYNIEDLWGIEGLKSDLVIDNPLNKEDFWMFLGTYLGDGYTAVNGRKHLISTCFGSNETLHIENYIDIVERVFNRKCRKRTRGNKTEIEFSSKQLHYFLKNNFGRYAHGKYLPEWVKYIDDKFKYQLICGYLNSDGCTMNLPNGYLLSEFVSVSLTMLEGFQDILFSLGIVSSLTLLRKEGETTFPNGVTSKTREAYMLRINQIGTLDLHNHFKEGMTTKVTKIKKALKNPIKGKNNCFLSEDLNYIYFKVKSIKKSTYTGKVYNFECDTNTFLTPHITTHNCDDYKQDESDESKKGSIGAFYIFDRLKRKIVLGLANRPDPHTDFHKQMHMALDAWNCMCFMENADMDFKKYLDRLTMATPDQYLYKGFDAYDDFSKFQNGTRKFGWRPDKNTVPIIRGYSVDYTKDNVDYLDDNDNVTHTVSGYERIDDIQLLEEMIKYKPDGNFDRLVAFGSCLAIDYYLTCKYITPHSHTQEKEGDDRPDKKKPQRTKFFTKTRRSPFSG